MSLTYAELQNSFETLSKQQLPVSSMFDYFLTPFVTSLGYQVGSIIDKGKIGTMILNHDPKATNIIAYPDEYSRIIFKFKEDKQEIPYDEKTLIVDFSLSEMYIDFIIPFFGKYVISQQVSFKDDDNKYETLILLISYVNRNSVKNDNQEALLYQLSVIHDIKTLQKKGIVKSELFLNSLNEIIDNADEDLINLVTDYVAKKSFIKAQTIKERFEYSLKNQDEDNYYKLEFNSDKEEIEPQVVKEENVATEVASAFYMNNGFEEGSEPNESEKGDDNDGTASLFKQR